MTENEVGKIALLIEKEMFNLFRVTDNRYKSKYRSLMFNLKDPKNQVCARPLGVGQPWPGAAQACGQDTRSPKWLWVSAVHCPHGAEHLPGQAPACLRYLLTPYLLQSAVFCEVISSRVGAAGHQISCPPRGPCCLGPQLASGKELNLAVVSTSFLVS